MIITHVRYTVSEEYAAQNKEHIGKVMDTLRALGRTDIKYSVFVEDDCKTFDHLLLCSDEEARKTFSSLAPFSTYQEALHAGSPETEAVVTNLAVVGSSYDLLG